LEVRERIKAKEEAKEEQRARRRKEALRGHVVTGVLTFTLLSLFLGFPESLQPLSLLTLLVFSVLLGGPLGLVIGLAGGGVIKGALISSAFFTVLRLILQIRVSLLGNGETSLMTAVLGGLFLGALPGAVIGLHISMRND